MELDLLGLGLPPATAAAAAAAAGHGGSEVQRHCYARTGFDEPLRFAAAPETPSRVRARMRRRAVERDGDNDNVPAPPAARLKPSAAAAPWPAPAQVRVPGAAGDKCPRASQLGSFRGMFPSTPSAPAPPLSQGAGAPAANGFGRAPPFPAGLVFEGSAAASSSSTNNPDHSTGPLTIIYAGSVRAFDSVPADQAEKILFMTANGAQAAETQAFQQQEPTAALPSNAAQMMMLLGLANVRDSLLPKRTASLARFLHKRKQRVQNAAKRPYLRGEELRAQMDVSTAVYARDKAPFGDMEQVWASKDGPKSMKEHHGEEAVNTELKI